MWTATSSTKCCATCSNWGGDRKVTCGGNAVETQHNYTQGRCYGGAVESSSKGQNACQGFSCAKYKKWAALR